MDESFYLFRMWETAFSLIGLSWALMGMVYIWFGKKRGGEGHALLMVLILALPLLQITLGTLLLLAGQQDLLGLHSIPMLFGPVFYFYTRKILNEPLAGFSGITPHLAPFFFFTLLELVVQTSTSQPLPPQTRQFSIFIYLHSAATAFSVLAYGTSIFYRTNKYQKTVENHFSSQESDITLSWLKTLAGGYVVLFGTSFMLLLALAPMFASANLSPLLITILPLDLFIIYFSYHSARQRVIVIDTAIDSPIATVANNGLLCSDEDKEKKYEKSALTGRELDKLSVNLRNYMERSKAYLDSELTLEKLAQKTEIPRHKLSQVLNRELEQTFYSFVNHFRIEEFESLVQKGKHENLSILGLAYECGFKSSSSFYNTIKKEKGKTPKQIIKELQG